MSSKAWVWTASAVAGLALASYWLFRVLSPAPLPEGVQYGSGHIEGTEIRVNSEITGRVLQTHIAEGELVEAGTLLVSLDGEELRIRLALAEAEMNAIRNGIEAQRAQLAVREHHLASASTDHRRFQELRSTGAATPQQLASAQDRLAEAQGQVRMLQAQLTESAARLQAAREQLNLLKLQLEKAQVAAPVDGTVLVKGIEAGELATPQTVLAVLVDLSRLRLRIYIPAKAIGRIHLGDEARVRVDAYPDRYFPARVTQIDQQAQFTPRDVHLPEERTRMVFGVELALDNPEGILKPGMPADAWIRWADDRAWPPRLEVPR